MIWNNSIEENTFSLYTSINSEVRILEKEILEILRTIQSQMNEMQGQMKQTQNQMNEMQNHMNQTQNKINEMQNHMNEIHVDIKIIKNTQKEHGDILNQLNSFEKNTQLAHERIDIKLKKIENGIEVLANEDFHIKTEMISVKEDLKVIKGGKE